MDMSEIPAPLKKCINHYRINLLEIQKLENTEVFQSDLRLIFDFIRCGKDKHKLRQLVEDNEEYQNMEEDAYDVAVFFSRAKELIQVKQDYTEGGKINMCQALTELINDGRMEGIQEGIQEGESNILALNNYLLLHNRIDDLKRASEEKEFREQLIHELWTNSKV